MARDEVHVERGQVRHGRPLLERMIDRGLLERRRSEDDRRAWSILVTDAGKDVLIDVVPNNAAAGRDHAATAV